MPDGDYYSLCPCCHCSMFNIKRGRGRPPGGPGPAINTGGKLGDCAEASAGPTSEEKSIKVIKGVKWEVCRALVGNWQTRGEDEMGLPGAARLLKRLHLVSTSLSRHIHGPQCEQASAKCGECAIVQI